MARTKFESLRVYQLAERLADEVWAIVREWPGLARDTVGKQVVRSADGIGANIAEGVGRGTDADTRRFVRIARGSLHETQHWLRRAFTRGLLTEPQVASLRPLVDELAPKLNAFLNSIGRPRRPAPTSPDVNPSPTTDQPEPTPTTDHPPPAPND
jgi:four helix bundle protein